MAIFSAVIFITLGVSCCRLFYIQVIDRERYVEIEKSNSFSRRPIHRKRGTIYDRNRRVLAISTTVNSLYAIPKEIVDLRKTIADLSAVLGDKEDQYLRKMMTNRNFVWIERKIEKTLEDKIRELKLPGLKFKKEYKRIYPGGALASNLLGFVGMDNQGLEGIELFFHKILDSTPGQETMVTDVNGYRIPMTEGSKLSPKGGNQLVLTIDEVIQHIAEEEIENIRREYKAKQAFGVINDPTTGEILAMVNVPNYDLNDFGKATEWVRKNRCITDVYEPGSTFKLITAIACLEEGKVKPGDVFHCPGYVQFGSHRLRCHLTHGDQTFEMGIANSCNAMIIKAAQKVGKKKFAEVIERVGFGHKTGITLPGEVSGIVHPVNRWADIDFGSMSIGQAISVTPLQLMMAESAVVNDGVMYPPRIINEILDASGESVFKYRQTPGRRICSADTSRLIRGMMRKVVEVGTGKKAAFMNFEVGGKTGTAQKAGADGKYDPDKNVASFIGFVPIDAPKFGILIVVDEPLGEKTYGGIVAAKAFKSIAERVLEYMGYFDKVAEVSADQIEVEDFKGMTPLEVFDRLEERAYNLKIIGIGDFVGYQYPSPGRQISKNSPITLYFVDREAMAANDPRPDSEIKRMPFVLGKTLKQVLTTFDGMEVSVKLNGSGVAFNQDPPPGELLLANTECVVEFKDE